MSRVQEFHVGNLLTVVGGLPTAMNSIVFPGRDLLPTTLGIGAASVPGSIYANGNVLIGNPTAFPLQEAALMVARPNALVNPMGAKCISLLKVTVMPIQWHLLFQKSSELHVVVLNLRLTSLENLKNYRIL